MILFLFIKEAIPSFTLIIGHQGPGIVTCVSWLSIRKSDREGYSYSEVLFGCGFSLIKTSSGLTWIPLDL